MKTKILLFLMISISSTAFSQGGEFRILPEGGLALPTGDFSANNVFASQGFFTGLNLDFFKGKFGIGLFGGINSNGIDYHDDLPPFSDLITSRTNRISKDSWQQLLVGLGPTYKIGLTEKLDLEFSLKIGFSKFTYPDYSEFIQTGDPLNQQYAMYETRNQDLKKGLDFATIPGMRLSFKPSEKLAISLGANYISAIGVLHSYSFLDGDFNPDMSDEQLEAALRTAPTETDVYKCTFNSIGVTLGVGFTFGGKDKPKDDPKEDEQLEPPTTQYPENGTTITPEEADSLVLEWLKEIPNMEKANYNLWLFHVADSTRKHDSLIYQAKVIRNQKILIPDTIKLLLGNVYRWKVQTLTANDQILRTCRGDCFSNESIFSISNPVYFELKRKLDAAYYNLENGLLRFKYFEEYADNGQPLEFNIYDYKRTVVISNLTPTATLNVMYKDNSLTLDINAINPSLPHGFYVLEVKDKKGEIWMLRFQN